MGCGPSIVDPRECHATPTAIGFRQFRSAPVSIFGRGDMAMSNEQQGIEERYREIAEKIRQLARQTPIREAQEELFELADNLDRTAELAKKTRG